MQPYETYEWREHHTGRQSEPAIMTRIYYMEENIDGYPNEEIFFNPITCHLWSSFWCGATRFIVCFQFSPWELHCWTTCYIVIHCVANISEWIFIIAVSLPLPKEPFILFDNPIIHNWHGNKAQCLLENTVHLRLKNETLVKVSHLLNRADSLIATAALAALARSNYL